MGWKATIVKDGENSIVKLTSGADRVVTRRIKGEATNPRVVERGDGYRSWYILIYRQYGVDKEMVLGPKGGVR